MLTSIVIFSLKYLLTKQVSRAWSLGILVCAEQNCHFSFIIRSFFLSYFCQSLVSLNIDFLYSLKSSCR